MKRTPLRSGGRLKSKNRSAAEFRRIYGSKARIEWVKRQACIVCFASGFAPDSRGSENAHTENEGLSRKAHYTKIIPLCNLHHRMYDNHEQSMALPEVRDAMKYQAFVTEQRWQSHLASTTENTE